MLEIARYISIDPCHRRKDRIEGFSLNSIKQRYKLNGWTQGFHKFRTYHEMMYLRNNQRFGFSIGCHDGSIIYMACYNHYSRHGLTILRRNNKISSAIDYRYNRKHGVEIIFDNEQVSAFDRYSRDQQHGISVKYLTDSPDSKNKIKQIDYYYRGGHLSFYNIYLVDKTLNRR